VTAAAWSFGLALFTLAAFAAQLVHGWRGGLRASVLVAAVMLSALWAGTGLAFSVSQAEGLWIAWRALDLLRAGAWCAFLLLLLNTRQGMPHETDGAERGKLALGAAVALGLVALAFAFPAFPPDASLPSTVQSRIGFALSLGLAVGGLVCVEQLLRNTPAGRRWGIKHLCLGLGGLFAFDLFMYADATLLGQFDASLWSAHGAVQALVIPFIAIATARNKEWTLDIGITRHVVFQSTALLGSGVYLLAVAAVGYYIRYFGGTWGATIQIAFLFGALLLLGYLLASGALRSKLRVLVGKHFFSYRYDYREDWLRFTRALSERDSDVGINERCVRALADLVESPGGALWLRCEGRHFRQVARWSTGAVTEAEPLDGALPRFLAATGWVVELREYRADPERYSHLVLPAWLESLPDAWLVVPLLASDGLLGFLVLANPRVKIDIDWEVRDLLKTAGAQAASYLGQIEAAEALLEARKFDAFNRMSAFVVHDLKNLVAQLQLLLRNAERHSDNAEFQRDMLETIRHVVGRMTDLLSQLRAGETPVENPRSIDVTAIARLVQRSKAGLNSGVDLDATPPVFALGHEDRLEHVLAHLVQNALDATPPEGRVRLAVRSDGDFAVVEIRDDGVGMTQEFVRDRLFKPFETTKKTGMGIGGYESHQYVTSIGGRILVESAPGEGTTIRVLLPLKVAKSLPTASEMREVA
jgi:putative PEP-CTERM system histidine kinase